MELEAVFTRYANDTDFNEKVRAATAAVDASPYGRVNPAVIAVALDAVLPVETPSKDNLQPGDEVEILPGPKFVSWLSDSKLRPCHENVLPGQIRVIKSTTPAVSERGNLVVEPGYLIAPEFVKPVVS